MEFVYFLFRVLTIIQINKSTIFYRSLKKCRYLSENINENVLSNKLYIDEYYDKNYDINNNSDDKYEYEEYESYKRIKKNKLRKNTVSESKLPETEFSKYKLSNDNTKENLKSHLDVNSLPSTSNSENYHDSKCNESINGSNSGTHELIEKPLSIKYPIYNWELGKECLCKYLGHSKDYVLNGVKFDEWKLVHLENKDYNERSGRVHRLLKTNISGNNEKKKMKGGLKLFIKKIPIDMWLKQFEMMDTYNGEYVLRAENFVMEAIVLSFLSVYHPGICPKFYKLLYNPDNYYKDENFTSMNNINDINIFNKLLSDRSKMNMSGYILIISESFGEDLKNYLCTTKYWNKSKKNKKKLLFESLKLINKLHQVGICHLDFTLDNILISKDGQMRLCDFGKSTPMYSYYLRHTKKMDNLCLFQSCITTIGKTTYIPPECWDLEKRFIAMQEKFPFEYLEDITDEQEREKYYFDVSCADKYMLGIVFIVIWGNGFLWYVSDPILDMNYLKFKKCKMDFNKVWTTFFWPKKLKTMLRNLLDLDCRKKLNLNELINDPWFTK
ncbi:serine/threonine protein kinase, FIKK family [Plasmodium gaboni]|uniref:non-specific serine/threonine protein kinase n=2 Tax=Plasmodium gaboni TaxID=647221 RepID=A0A151LLG3_9APIC|nr:serine/threonine protein kinase, FIKK family [Plasmodium gaboni]KYO00008.1 serine/threonine protein kinase, FIKK family [Plasmodium gaboni]